MNYFKDCNTVSDIKKRYKELAFLHHPDHGGNTATMQKVNHEYEIALKNCDGQTSVDNEGKEHTYKYNSETEKLLIELIDKLLSLKMIDVDIYLVGLWIWIDGETKPYKDSLKELKCKWHSTRKLWYFATTPSYARKNTSKGIDDIAQTYGAKKISRKFGL